MQQALLNFSKWLLLISHFAVRSLQVRTIFLALDLTIYIYIQTRVALYYVWSFTCSQWTCILPIYIFFFFFFFGGGGLAPSSEILGAIAPPPTSSCSAALACLRLNYLRTVRIWSTCIILWSLLTRMGHYIVVRIYMIYLESLSFGIFF